MSLNGVLKRVKGVVGRNAPTGITNLTSWAAFEEEVSWIWKNARDYNEDGSDLYNLSIEFEVGNIPDCQLGIILTCAGTVQEVARRSKSQGRRTPAAEAETQHVRSSQAATEAQAST